MGVSAGTRTISDGLVLALDAANTRSYPGSGTTWTDLSGRGNNGTLTNGPSFVRPTFREPFGGAGSVYFDGSGDYLSLDATAGNAGTGNFTMEWWFLGSSIQINDNRSNHITTSSTDIYYQPVYGTNLLVFSNNFNDGSWHHHAVVRSSGVITYYIDGVSQASANYSSSVNSTTPFDIGRGFFGNMSGYVSNFRFVTSAVYTSAFTPPTAPLTAITNTSLLLNFTNGGIIDNASKNVLETVGNAQISTSVKKFGTGSMYFDGTGDYLSVVSSSNFAFGTGDFTIEYWINTSTSADNGILQISTTAGGFATSYTNGLMMSLFSGTLYYALGGSSANTGTTINNGNWRHITMCRSGSSLKIFVDGISIVSTTNTTNVTATNLVIGGYYSTSYTLSGYIDDLRITRGVARYTTNFPPPTAAFADKF